MDFPLRLCVRLASLRSSPLPCLELSRSGKGDSGNGKAGPTRSEHDLVHPLAGRRAPKSTALPRPSAPSEHSSQLRSVQYDVRFITHPPFEEEGVRGWLVQAHVDFGAFRSCFSKRPLAASPGKRPPSAQEESVGVSHSNVDVVEDRRRSRRGRRRRADALRSKGPGPRRATRTDIRSSGREAPSHPPLPAGKKQVRRAGSRPRNRRPSSGSSRVRTAPGEARRPPRGSARGEAGAIRSRRRARARRTRERHRTVSSRTRRPPTSRRRRHSRRAPVASRPRVAPRSPGPSGGGAGARRARAKARGPSSEVRDATRRALLRFAAKRGRHSLLLAAPEESFRRGASSREAAVKRRGCPRTRRREPRVGVGLSRFERASARAAGTNTTFCQRTSATRPATAPARKKPRAPRSPRCGEEEQTRDRRHREGVGHRRLEDHVPDVERREPHREASPEARRSHRSSCAGGERRTPHRRIPRRPSPSRRR